MVRARLFICVKNPFTSRDYERFGIEILEQHFDLLILDCTAWLLPIAYQTRNSSDFKHHSIKKIVSLREFKSAISGFRQSYLLDYVGQFSPRAILMFDAIRRAGIKIVVIDSGAHPAHNKTRRSLYEFFFNSPYGVISQRISSIVTRLLLFFLPPQNPDIALVAGNFWKQNLRFTRSNIKLPSHSFDYELYLQSSIKKPLTDMPYAVYLDERITSHEDNKEMGLPNPATPNKFYPSLIAFLNKLENLLGFRVVIAGYPGSKVDELKYFLGGREVFIGDTPTLLRHSRLVLVHGSTAVSHAVISYRPVIFLTSTEIIRSWYQASIEVLRSHLGCSMVNIDDPDTVWQIDWMFVNKHSYTHYIDTFIKNPNAKDESIWDILISVLRPNKYNYMECLSINLED